MILYGHVYISTLTGSPLLERNVFMKYELSPEEKIIVIKNRLATLDADFSRSGTDVTMFQMDNGDAMLTLISDGGSPSEKSMSVSICDADANVLYEFLKNRYELKKELNQINDKMIPF